MTQRKSSCLVCNSYILMERGACPAPFPICFIRVYRKADGAYKLNCGKCEAKVRRHCNRFPTNPAYQSARSAGFCPGTRTTRPSRTSSTSFWRWTALSTKSPRLNRLRRNRRNRPGTSHPRCCLKPTGVRSATRTSSSGGASLKKSCCGQAVRSWSR